MTVLGNRSNGDLWTKIKTSIGRLRTASDGVSAVEFAFILPTMIMLYIGAFEFCQAITIDRRVTSVSSAAADLVAQAENTSNSELKEIFNAAKSIMAPYDLSTIEITLTSVVADENNDTTVDWSRKYDKGTIGAGHSKGAAFTLPAGLTTEFTSVIVAEVAYEFTPLVSRFLTKGITLRETFYLRPRRSQTVVNSDS